MNTKLKTLALATILALPLALTTPVDAKVGGVITANWINCGPYGCRTNSVQIGPGTSHNWVGATVRCTNGITYYGNPVSIAYYWSTATCPAGTYGVSGGSYWG